MTKTINIKLWLLFLIYIILLFIVAFTIFSYIHPTDTVIRTWKQPDSIKYDKPGPFYLSVVEDDIYIGRLPFSATRRYYIYLGRDSGKPIHGHVVNYSFHPGTDYIHDIKGYISTCNVTWTADGVTFEEASGHKLFIPKNMLGGR